MKKHAALLIPLMAAPTAWSADFTYDARNDAMGGAAVASSHYSVAAFSNPALITYWQDADDFALVLNLGASYADPDELIDGLDGVQDHYDLLEERLEANDIAGSYAAGQALRESLLELRGDAVTGGAGVGLAVTVPNRFLTTSWFVHSSVDVKVSAELAESDILWLDTVLAAPQLFNGLPDLQSQGIGVAAAVTDVGVAFAHRFERDDWQWSVGLTPKLQRIDTFNYVVSADDYDTDDISDDRYRNDTNHFNADVGLSAVYKQHWLAGLSVRNVISKSVDTEVIQGQVHTYHVQPLATVGVAYRGDVLTASFDADLTKTKRFGDGDESQFFRAGIELDAWDWIQLRAGYRYDSENYTDDMVTAGVGFSPWGVFHLDITGMKGGAHAYGAAIDLAMTF